MMMKRILSNFIPRKLISFPKSNRYHLKAKLLDDVFLEIKKYLIELRNKEGKVVEFKTDKELKEIFDFKIDDNIPSTNEEILDFSKKILKYSVHAGHPNYHNTLFGGFSEYALIGDYIQSTLNGSIFTFESAPLFTLMEDEIGKKYSNFLGWKEYDFILCPGGSFANMYALICARYHNFPEVKTKGLKHLPQLKIFTSELAHYSLDKGSMVLGIGLENVVKVKTDEKGKMIPSDLEKKIQECLKKGDFPMLVNSTMGTTVFGANDPVNENSTICKKYGIWHHIDACYGGAQMFLEDFREKMKLGFLQSDSISMDQHKVLNVPQQSTIFLSKHKDILENSNSTHANYLFMKDKVAYDFHLDTGDKSIQCSRHIDVAKFWLYWKAHSTMGIQNLVREARQHAIYLAKLVKDHPNFELIVEPEYLTVSFYFFPDHILGRERDEKFWEEVDSVAPIIKSRMVKKGSLMIAYQRQNSSYKNLVNFFRPSITLGKDKEDIEKIVSEIYELGHDVRVKL